MKHKNVFTVICMAMIFMTALSSCKKGCKEEQPRARITNNGTDKASVQIKTSGGNTVNINNIERNQSSAWASYAPGNLEFTVAIQGVLNDTMIAVTMVNCWEYDIMIDSLNRVSSSPAERE